MAASAPGDEPVRVAVLGLGSAGSRHCRHLVEAGAQPVAWDPDQARATPPGVSRAESAAAALELGDAAIIASPNVNHAEQAIAAIDARLPTLVEKPLATTAADADRVAAKAEERGVACGVAMNLRYLPAIAELRRLVESGELGTIMRGSFWFGYDLRRWRPEVDYRTAYSARAELGGGIVLDAIHELDYMAWLLGPARAVSAVTARVSDLEIDVEDTAVAAIELASGAVAALDLDFVAPAYRRGCVLTGTDAVATWDFNDEAILVTAGDGAQRRIDAAGAVAGTYAAEVEDFLRSIREGTPPNVGAREGAAAVGLADAIKRSSAEGRRIELTQG
jgi:predicted dehydrogenase